MSVVKTFRELNLGDGNRPAKRRKTFPDSTEDVGGSTYEQVMMVLNGNTQASPVLNLSNLQNIVQYVSRVSLTDSYLREFQD